MSTPTRYTSGFTQSAVFQPLGNIGIPNPFFYASYDDDFLPYNVANYTPTLDGGTVAATAVNGSGGRIVLTTAAVATDFVGLQLPAAGFQYVAGKKLAYVCRLQLTTPASTGFIVGLLNNTATPSAPTDGIYFQYVAGGTTIALTAMTGSVVIGTSAIAIPPVAATDIDLGFYVNPEGNIFAYVGTNLVGNATRQDVATLGAAGKLYSSTSLAGTPQLTGAITSVLLNPTLSVSTTGPANALIADFQFAAQER